MSFDNIISGDYGQIAILTILDTDTDSAADISGYSSSIQMIFTSPAGVETAKTATFVTDGTDGQIKYTIESGLLNAAGKWQVRGRVQSASAKLTSTILYFTVLN